MKIIDDKGRLFGWRFGNVFDIVILILGAAFIFGVIKYKISSEHIPCENIDAQKHELQAQINAVAEEKAELQRLREMEEKDLIYELYKKKLLVFSKSL